MRHQLLPFEGTRVAYSGRLSQFRTSPCGLVSVCLVNCSVRRHAPHSPQLLEPEVLVDHFWLHGMPDTDDMPVPRQMLSQLVGVGTVGWYTRSNGSIDLGLNWSEALMIPKAEDRIARLLAEPRSLDGDEGIARFALDVAGMVADKPDQVLHPVEHESAEEAAIRLHWFGTRLLKEVEDNQRRRMHSRMPTYLHRAGQPKPSAPHRAKSSAHRIPFL